jgi:heme A synthase
MSQLNLPRPRRIATRLYLALTLTMLAASSWLLGKNTTDDRGSDSSEKSLMIILAISVGGVVTVAAGAYIAGKTALFK